MARAVLTGQGASPQKLPSAHLTTLSFAISSGRYTALEISSPYPYLFIGDTTRRAHLYFDTASTSKPVTYSTLLLPQSLSPTVQAGQGAFPTLPPLSMKGAHELRLDSAECTYVFFSYNPCGPGSVSNIVHV